MHQTTLRFPEDLWRFLEEEAKSLGVSVAQYVREAALARAAYDAGRRGEPMFVDQAVLQEGLTLSAMPAPQPAPLHARAIAGAEEVTSDSAAVWAQARLVRRRSEQLREQSRLGHAGRVARGEQQL
jgi:hypothetical protein